MPRAELATPGSSGGGGGGGGGGKQGTPVPKKCPSELASEVIAALLIAFNAPQHLW